MRRSAAISNDAASRPLIALVDDIEPPSSRRSMPGRPARRAISTNASARWRHRRINSSLDAGLAGLRSPLPRRRLRIEYWEQEPLKMPGELP